MLGFSASPILITKKTDPRSSCHWTVLDGVTQTVCFSSFHTVIILITWNWLHFLKACCVFGTSALVLSSCPWKREAGAIPLVTEEQILLHCSPLLPSWWLLKSFLFFFFFTCFDFFTHKMELSFFKGKWKVSGVRNGGEGSCYSKAPNVHFRFVF